MTKYDDDEDVWNEFLNEYGSGNIRRTPDGRRVPY